MYKRAVLWSLGEVIGEYEGREEGRDNRWEFMGNALEFGRDGWGESGLMRSRGRLALT